MATNYTKIYNDLTLTECELYEYLNTNKGFCCEKGWKWENDVTGVVKTGREWKKYWQTSPPDCSGCTSPFVIVRPLIIGDPLVGGSLSVDNGTWGGTLPITYSYQWYADGSPILGATNDNLDLVSNYLGQTIKCEVTALNICGSASSDSNNVTVVSAPINTIANSISGNNYEGEVLTTTNGTWSGTATITYSYQWYRGSTPIGTNSSTYTQVSADAGYDIKCVVTASNIYGSSNSSSSTQYCFTSEYNTYRAYCLSQGYTFQSASVQRKEDQAIILGKANGALAATDMLYFLQGDGDINTKQVNVKNPSGTRGTWSGGYAVKSGKGIKGNGTDARFNTNIKLNALTNYQAGNCSIGVYTDKSSVQEGYNTMMLWGASDGTNQSLFYMSTVGWDWQAKISGTVDRDSNITLKAAESYSVEYNGANVTVRAGSTSASIAQTTLGTRPNFELCFLCRGKTTPDQFSTATLSYAYVGSAVCANLWKAVFDVVYPTIAPAEPTVTLLADFDFNNTAKLWQNLAKTTAVSALNDPIRVVETVAGTWAQIEAANDSERPFYKPSGVNGKGVAKFDGVDDNFNFPSPITSDFFILFVVKNSDTALGSHLLADGHYMGVTGSGYGPNSAFGGEYIYGHPNVGASGGLKLKNQGNTYNVIGYGVENGVWSIFNGLGIVARTANGATFSYSKNGKEYITNWQFNGEEARLLIYQNKPIDNIIEQTINTLNSTYNV